MEVVEHAIEPLSLYLEAATKKLLDRVKSLSTIPNEEPIMFLGDEEELNADLGCGGGLVISHALSQHDDAGAALLHTHATTIDSSASVEDQRGGSAARENLGERLGEPPGVDPKSLKSLW
jgi:hypothetical protein